MKTIPNDKPKNILFNSLAAALGLMLFGFGTYLTIQANIGAGPWDVFNLGLSKTFGILYGNASIAVSAVILIIDIILKEPIGIGMFLDAVLVGKTVDLLNYLNLIPKQENNIFISICLLLTGLVIMGYSQFIYMRSALGCGPRDSFLVGLKRRIKKIPIGIISVILLGAVTLAGYLLGGPVGIGTVICAALIGPVMQFAFFTVKFRPTEITHQNIFQSFRVIIKK